MNLFTRLGALFRQRPQCPLCGGTSTYRVFGFIGYAKLLDELKDRQKWQKAHGLQSGVPQFPSEYDTSKFRIPGFSLVEDKAGFQSDGLEHRRCKECDTLLPPEFWSGGMGNRDFSITVAGFGGTGKTTWLLNMLNPARNDHFEIIRRSQMLRTLSYEYAEPGTLAALRGGARTVIPYFLFGTTIRFSSNLIFVKTLDIMGEKFLDDHVPETKTLIARHLSGGSENGALLILDKFSPRAPSVVAKRPVGSIAQVYEEISPNASVWRGVVWTHLDQAQWGEAGEAWLKENLPDQSAAALVQLAASLQPDAAFLSDEIRTQLDQIDSKLIWSLAGLVMRSANMRHETYDLFVKKHKDMPRFEDIPIVSVDSALEALIFLLLRLQMAYSLKAARHDTGKYEYLEKGGGQPIYAGILGLARALYVLWDSGNLAILIKEDPHFEILPCGLIGDCSVWSDLILLRAMHGSGVI